MARIFRFHHLGGAQALTRDEVEVPAPGPGEVRIRTRALGLNRAEVMFRSGRYVVEPALPSAIGYEASGEVESVGSGVDGLEVGNPVSIVPAFAKMQVTGHSR